MSRNKIGHGCYIIQMEDGDRIGFLVRPIRGNCDNTRRAGKRQLRGCTLPADLDFRKDFALEAFDENQIARSGFR